MCGRPVIKLFDYPEDQIAMPLPGLRKNIRHCNSPLPEVSKKRSVDLEMNLPIVNLDEGRPVAGVRPAFFAGF